MINVSPLASDFGLIVEGDSHTPLESIDIPYYLDQFRKSDGGALLFRNFNADLQSFRKITNQFGTDFKVAYTNIDERDYPDQDLSLATVNKGGYAINFHPETNIPFSADAFWMFCIRPAKEKGRTGIVDGVQVIKELTSETLKYLQFHGGYWDATDISPEEWSLVFPDHSPTQLIEKLQLLENVFDIKIDQANNYLSFKFNQPPISKTKFCNQEAFIGRLLEWPNHILKRDGVPYNKHVLTEVNQAVYKHAVWIDWQPGDFLLLNNTRVMHAREAFEDPQRKILVRYSNLADDILVNN